MTEVVMMQAAMFQLRTAMESIDDPFIRTQVRLAAGILGNAIDGAANGVNAAAVNEIAFAMNDVVAAAADAPELEPPGYAAAERRRSAQVGNRAAGRRCNQHPRTTVE